MKIIKEILEHIEEEIEGICSYIKFATEVKGENEYIFETLMEIIPQEIKHVDVWHTVAMREIEKIKIEMRDKGAEVPHYMLDMWQEAHEEFIEEMAKIKYKLELLKKTY